MHEAAQIEVASLTPPPVVRSIKAVVEVKQATTVLATAVRRAELGEAPAQYAIALRLGRDIIIVPVPPPAAPPRPASRRGNEADES